MDFYGKSLMLACKLLLCEKTWPGLRLVAGNRCSSGAHLVTEAYRLAEM